MLSLLKSKPQKKKNNFIAGLPVPAFNPIDANTVALWDGDVDLNNAKWIDVIAAQQIDFFNSPTIDAAGLNGHGTVTFDGINQYGQNLTDPILITPYTIYLVFKQMAWLNGNIFYNNGDILEPFHLWLTQTTTTPNLRMRGLTGNLILSPILNLNTWGILTILYNGINSKFRLNKFSRITGSTTSSDTFGITIAAAVDLGNFVNCAFAYIIYRNGADNILRQDNTVSWLQNRFAI
jgi:hypothetical protein